jgi:uncharacterized membrane protein YgcG
MKIGLSSLPFVVLLATRPAYGESERIEKFSSDIAVARDGGLRVTETIKVFAAGDKIEHGIYRDLLTVYQNRQGERARTAFEIEEVTRNGEKEPFHTAASGDSLRVYAGSENVRVSYGWNTYTFTYGADRGVGFFKDRDELYWNVNGTAWEFPIDVVECSVSLPGSVAESSLLVDAWTGTAGAKGNDFLRAVGSDGRIRFQTTRPFGPGENLTISVSWPKGLGAEPGWKQKAASFVRDYQGQIVPSVGVLAVFLYYLLVWYLVGRDPKKGTIVPLFSPPQDLSPAALRYIERMGYDGKCLAAALIAMAVKRHITIEKNQGQYTLHKLSDQSYALSPEEEAASSALFAGRDTIVLVDAFHEQVSSAISAVKKSLQRTYRKNYFALHGLYLLPGIFMSLVAIVVAGQLAQEPVHMRGWNGALVTLMLLSMGTVMGIAVWKATFALARTFFRPWSANWCTLAVVNIFASLFCPAVAFFLVVNTGLLPFEQTCIMAVALFGLGLLFRHLLKARTPAGRKLMDEIEGFKMFLGAAEKDRIRQLDGTGVTPGTFDKYLPYALALDVEDAWAQQLAAALAPSGGIALARYTPRWYSGADLDLADIGRTFGSALSVALSSSSTDTSGSSGGSYGGGGGSSGGGGGGGGGGGW